MSKQAQNQTQNEGDKKPNQLIQPEQVQEKTAVSTPFSSLQRAYLGSSTLTSAKAQLLQRTIGNQTLGQLAIQRQEEDEEELQMSAANNMAQGGKITSDIEQSIQNGRSGGHPLSNPILQPMENAFNANFSNVKIHTDQTADVLNRSLSARAFTTGQDIFFRSGAYNPGSSTGQELLAHELTHTIQQGSATVRRRPKQKRQQSAANPFLLGGLGSVSSVILQRAQAFAQKDQPTYRADPQDANKVYNTSIRGTRRTGHTISHYETFDIADQAAPNKPQYTKITNGRFPDEFVYRPNYLQVNPNNDQRVVKAQTHIKEGKQNSDWETAESGDVLDITGKTEDDAYYIGRNKRINGKTGSIAQEKTRAKDNDLAAAGNQYQEAATTSTGTPLHTPLNNDRDQSVGIQQNLLHQYQVSGTTVNVDFTASGVDHDGEKSLYPAQNARHLNMRGYIPKTKVRSVAQTTTGLEQEYQQEVDDDQAQLEQITTDFVVTHNTKFRQPEQSGNGSITFKDNYALEPGEILTRTNNSRAVFKDNKMWATEMLWRGKYLGMVNMERAQVLADDQKAVLKLNQAIDGPRPKNTLQKVLVTQKTTMRAIKDQRRHTFAVGDQTYPLSKDDVIYVDFSIKGVDENFNYGWVFAQTDNGSFGYVREAKVTKPHKEGNVRTVEWNGTRFEGNEIPAADRFIYKGKHSILKRGDQFAPDQDRALATNDYYYFLNNLRNGRTYRILKDNTILASPPLTAVAEPDTAAIITDKAHLRRPVENRNNHNSGATDTKLGDQLQPGDKLQVNFQVAGVFAKGDTDWYYAKKDAHTGYIRGSKVREATIDQLKGITQQAFVPDKFIPAYVTSKTHLRDENNKKKETQKPGDQILVNFYRHPLRHIKPENSEDYRPSGFANTDTNRWLLTQHDDDKPRYIREHKVTVQIMQPDTEKPSEGSSSGTAYQAFKMLTGAVKDVNFELAGGWGVGTTGDIYSGVKGLKGMEDGQEIQSGFFKNPSQGPVHGGEYQNLAIAGVAGGLMGLINTAEGLRDLFGPGRNWKQRLLGMLNVVQSGLSGVVASARAAENIYAIKDPNLQSSDSSVQEASSSFEAFDMAGKVAGWAGGIANSISAIKGLFLSIHSFVTSHKKAPERGVSLLRDILDAGQAGIKAARFFTKIFEASSTHALAVSVPIIGIAVDMANIILGAFKTYRGRTSENQAGSMLAQENLKQKVILAVGNQGGLDTTDPHKHDAPNKLFWKEFRGVRSVNTAFTKTSYHRLNPKIMFAIRNKDELDKRDGIGPNANVVERSPRYINSDYYQVTNNQGQPTGSVVAVINGAHIEITLAAEKAIREYELVSKVQEVGKKKRVIGIEEIEKGVLNLIGDILGMGGPSAMAGAITKGVTAAIDAGFNFSRFLNKQWDNHKGKEFASYLKYQGKIKGVDKSQGKKQREYYDHAIFVLQEISDLATPQQVVAASQDENTLDTYRQNYAKVQKHVEMTGVHTGMFYDAAGKPVEQVELLVEALSDR